VPSQGPWVYRFRDCVIDVWQRRAVVGGKPTVISRAGWSFLLILLTERDRVVSADELKSATWGELPVSASAVSTVIHALRRRLGDTGGNQTVIRTVYGRGFRFVAELEPPAEYDAQPTQWSTAGSPAALSSATASGSRTA
jgi:DNA-binding winged helix-turn-helix (wHTH) protein